MKNLLEENVQQYIFKRIESLTPESKAVWGKMNVNQNLRHLTNSFLIPLGKLNPSLVNPPSIPKWLLKFFLLNVSPPKNKAETYSEINMVANNVNPLDFNEEKTDLIEMIKKFVNTKSFINENILVGKFSRTDWGKLNYNHLDHHLKQFGV